MTSENTSLLSTSHFQNFNDIHSEARRAANIARNNALLAELELKEASNGLGITPAVKPSVGKGKGKRAAPATKSAAKPVQSRKRPREEKEHPPPRATRSSARTAAKESAPPPGETAEQKKKRLVCPLSPICKIE